MIQSEDYLHKEKLYKMEQLITLAGLETFLTECRSEFANNQEFELANFAIDELQTHVGNALSNNPVTIRNGVFSATRLATDGSGDTTYQLKPNSLIIVQGNTASTLVGLNGSRLVDSDNKQLSDFKFAILMNTDLNGSSVRPGYFRSLIVMQATLGISSKNYEAELNNYYLKAGGTPTYIFALEYNESLYNRFKANSLELTGARSDGNGERNTVFVDGNIAPEPDGTQKYSSKIHMFNRAGEKVIDILAKNTESSYIGVYEPVQRGANNVYSQNYSQQTNTDFATFRNENGTISETHRLSNKVNGSNNIKSIEYLASQTAYDTLVANNQINSTTLYFIKDAELGE